MRALLSRKILEGSSVAVVSTSSHFDEIKAAKIYGLSEAHSKHCRPRAKFILCLYGKGLPCFERQMNQKLSREPMFWRTKRLIFFSEHFAEICLIFTAMLATKLLKLNELKSGDELDFLYMCSNIG